ncbi:MAG: GntP family permease [Propionibacteriaceae bacterium]|jgi:GntP family gluconate:H+ symporter|nr:GntP family permease [Propionibacteriaceae bacterium]
MFIPLETQTQTIVAALIGLVLLIGLITWLKVHPFIALFASAIAIGLMAGHGAVPTVTSFANSFGSTMASVGILVGLGAMFGKLLADTGGADRIVDTLVAKSSPKALPWTMALVGAIIGLPMFFEVGLVLLVPVVLLVARRSQLPLMRVAIPTLAGLSAMHGLVPPHPGPLAALSNFEGSNLGLTLGLGVLVAIPTVIVSGPLFSKLAAKWVDVPVPAIADALVGGAGDADPDRPRPSFFAAVGTILLPVVLMLANAVYQIVSPPAAAADGSKLPRPLFGQVLEFIGTPSVALLIAVAVAAVVLGCGGRLAWQQVNDSIAQGLPAIAGILLIVGAGGGLKGVLVDTGIGQAIATFVENSPVPLVLLAWLVAVVIRIATGSATVSIVTTAGILAPAAAGASSVEISLLVLAIGAGSVFLSHVNDAGFWLVKEYFGLTVGQNFKTWSLLECLLSTVALAFVLLLNAILL